MYSFSVFFDGPVWQASIVGQLVWMCGWQTFVFKIFSNNLQNIEAIWDLALFLWFLGKSTGFPSWMGRVTNSQVGEKRENPIHNSPGLLLYWKLTKNVHGTSGWPGKQVVWQSEWTDLQDERDYMSLFWKCLLRFCHLYYCLTLWVCREALDVEIFKNSL